ncbi:MAG: glycoside hydrolase, partial [Tannerella sp.]|nr:glycoside hydrolase [Tannerella sp.]
RGYPEFSQFKELPAWGFYLRHADGVTFNNVTLRAAAPDYRPAIVTDDVRGVTFRNVKFSEPGSEGKQQIFNYKSSNIIIE